MNYRSVNLERLQPYEAPGIFTRISPEIDSAIEIFPELYERINGCVAFCHQIGMKYEGEEELGKRRKYLRAALAEFVSLEDAAELDCQHKSTSSDLGILSLEDARLHVVRLLRHANIHLSASHIERTSRPATWDSPDGVIEFDYTILYVPNIHDSIVSTRQAKKYRESDLELMIQWIEKEQMEWGVNHLVLKSAEQYAKEFLTKCT